MTYYELLEISENASAEVIKVAYKALAKKYHPDVLVGDSKVAEEKMKQINAAFDVLSDEQKRQQYDEFLHNHRKRSKHNDESCTTTQKTEVKEGKKNISYPSATKSGLIIGILLFVIWCQPVGTYAEIPGLFDYAILLGTVSFSLICLITMTAPMFLWIIKRNCTPKNIKNICLINSIALFGISTVLFVSELISDMFIGGVGALLYYFINKHILLQLNKHSCPKNKVLLVVIILILALTTIVIGGIALVHNDSEQTIENNSSIKQNDKIDYYADVTGEIFQLSDCSQCAVVRAISFDDKFLAEYVFELIKYSISDEIEIIAIMDEYCSYQGGGKGHLIEPGDYVEEVDKWVFDRDRSVGDIAIIETPYGYTICYISAIFE